MSTTSNASSTNRTWKKLFHSVTTDELATKGGSVETVETNTTAAPPNQLNRPQTIEPDKQWQNKGQAFRVDRGHIIREPETPVAPVRPQPGARPVSPSEIGSKAVSGPPLTTPQIEQLSNHLHQRQTEILQQRKSLSAIAGQHEQQLKQFRQLQELQQRLLLERLELSIEEMRQRLLILGHELSSKIPESHPLFVAFEETCRAYSELERVAQSIVP